MLKEPCTPGLTKHFHKIKATLLGVAIINKDYSILRSICILNPKH